MNPKQFLQIGGTVLVLIGILGMVNILGPNSESSVFGALWWFDQYENWTHLLLGIVGLAAAFTLPESLQKPFVIMLGAAGIIIGLYSLFVGESFFGANLENPADTLLHLTVGAWALWASLKGVV